MYLNFVETLHRPLMHCLVVNYACATNDVSCNDFGRPPIRIYQLSHTRSYPWLETDRRTLDI